MEHAKKMILVPHDLLLKLNQQKQNQSGLTNDLDTEMTTLLDNEDLGEKEKWVRYQQMLQRYLKVKEQERQPLKVTMEEESKHGADMPGLSLQREIIEAIPKMYKNKAKMLLNRLESSKNVSWDERGEVTIKGNIVLGSNIIDLVSDVVRPRKTSNPFGWQQFLTFLKELNIPREFITNPRRLSFIDRGVLTSTTSLRKRPLIRRSPLNKTVRRVQSQTSPAPEWRPPPVSSSDEEPQQSTWERYHF